MTCVKCYIITIIIVIIITIITHAGDEPRPEEVPDLRKAALLKCGHPSIHGGQVGGDGTHVILYIYIYIRTMVVRLGAMARMRFCRYS
jgi:hypothetical protein